MLPDPFTAVVGGVGLLSSLFALLISSVQTIHDAHGDFTTYSTKLQSLKHRVEDVDRGIRIIEEIWDLGYSIQDSMYMCVFGDAAKTEAVARIQNLQECMDLVWNVFRKGYDIKLWREHVGWLPRNNSAVLQPGDTSKWRKWAKKISASFPKRVRNVKVLDADVAKRIAFAMIRRADLEKKVGDLEQALKSLKSCLEDHFERLPDICNKPPRPRFDYLMSLSRLQTNNKTFAQYMSDVRAIATDSNQRCGIFLDLDKREMMFRNHLEVPPKAIEIFISMSTFSDFEIVWPEQIGYLEHLKNQVFRHSYVNLPPLDLYTDLDSLHDLYDRMHQWRDEDLAVYQKCSEDERYRTVLSLIVTANLLWNTPWIDKLCTCSLEPRHTFETEPCVLIWPVPLTGLLRCQHVVLPPVWTSPEHGNSIRLARLGLAICEIALCSPVTTLGFCEKTTFTYRRVNLGRDLAPRYERCEGRTTQQLLEDVHGAMRGLQDAQLLSILTRMQRSGCSRSIPTYMHSCSILQKDQDGLRRYYEDICRPHRQDQSSRRWSQALKQRANATMLSSMASKGKNRRYFEPPQYVLSASPFSGFDREMSEEAASNGADREVSLPIRQAYSVSASHTAA